MSEKTEVRQAQSGSVEQRDSQEENLDGSQTKKSFTEPKLTFIEPKLTKYGDATKVTAGGGGFFGAFYPD